MSALSAIEAPVVTVSPVPDEPGTVTRPGQQRLQASGVPVLSLRAEPTADPGRGRQPRSSSIPVPQIRAPGLRRTAPPGPAARLAGRGVLAASAGARSARAPVRLTRRGRVVVAALIILGATVAALLISVAASGGAQATNHGQPRAGYQGMREVVVRPGQTLWSIASAAEPTADPRMVIQQIIAANALTGTTISSGQLLWVPR